MCPATAETWEAVTYEAILDGSRPSTSAPKIVTVAVHLAHDARVFDEESALWQRTSKKEAEEAARTRKAGGKRAAGAAAQQQQDTVAAAAAAAEAEAATAAAAPAPPRPRAENIYGRSAFVPHGDAIGVSARRHARGVRGTERGDVVPLLAELPPGWASGAVVWPDGARREVYVSPDGAMPCYTMEEVSEYVAAGSARLPDLPELLARARALAALGGTLRDSRHVMRTLVGLRRTQARLDRGGGPHTRRARKALHPKSAPGGAT